MDKLIILCLLGDPTLPPVSVKHTGGFQVDIQELLYNINNPNCEIHIITNTSKYSPKIFENNNGTYIHRIKFNENWLDDQNLMMENFEFIKKEFFKIMDLIINENSLIHSFYWLSGILAMEAKKYYNINFVHSVVSLSVGKTLSGASPYYINQFKYEKKFLLESSKIFSITESEKEQIQKYYYIETNKIVVVGRDVASAYIHPAHNFDGLPENIKPTYNEINPVELTKYKWWAQGAYTYVGRLQKIKGLHHIIYTWLELYKRYENKTPPLWICGGTPKNISDFRAKIKNYIDFDLLEKCENAQKIIWWGYLDPAGISTLFLKTRVFIMHSQYEPGGRVILEALASSLPVIATNNGFAKDMIKNNYNGFLVEYGNIEALYSAMEYFLNESVPICELKQNAKKTFLAQQKYWKCYLRHFEIYQELGLLSFGDLIFN